MMTCDICGGLLALLGVLGRLAHLRCIQCGMGHSCPASDIQEDE